MSKTIDLLAAGSRPEHYENVRNAYIDDHGFFNIIFCDSDTNRVCIASDLVLRYVLKEQDQ